MTAPLIKVEDVVAERNAQYLDAWSLTGEVVAMPVVAAGLNRLLTRYPRYWFNWVMILNKLIRALGSPAKLDHWVDIQGYAKLTADDIQRTEESKG